MSKYAFIIEPSEHAELSASSADRWFTCAGSVDLSKGIPNYSTEYAASGTAAHYIGSECLKDGGSPLRWLGKKALVEGFEINIDEEMVVAVQDYVDDCREDTKPGDVVLVEQSFSALKKLHPKLGGSGDRVRWRPSTRQLRTTDFKFGAGIAVEVDDNRQLKIYALGALLANPEFNANEVELRIVQPRCEHEQGRSRSYKFPAFELLDFAADVVEAAKATEDPLAKLVPSTKACKFCPAFRAKVCPAVEEQNHALVQAAFKPLAPEKYSPEQIAEFLTKAPLVEAHINAIREFAYQRVMAGEHYPGWKLVEKRATRQWRDEQAARAAFQSLPGAMTQPELRSPAQIEKLVGKKKFAEATAELVVKESSGYALAPAEDKRAPVTPVEKVLQLFGPADEQK